MSLTSTTESTQQRLHWLAERVLDWSGLPVAQVRPTVFLENPLFMAFAVSSIATDDTIRLPFGSGRTSPVTARDVAEVIATILADPAPHLGKIYELTGPRSEDLTAMAAEFSAALGRPVRYVDVPTTDGWPGTYPRSGCPTASSSISPPWRARTRRGRYDRVTGDAERILGRSASGVGDFVAAHAALFERGNDHQRDASEGGPRLPSTT